MKFASAKLGSNWVQFCPIRYKTEYYDTNKAKRTNQIDFFLVFASRGSPVRSRSRPPIPSRVSTIRSRDTARILIFRVIGIPLRAYHGGACWRRRENPIAERKETSSSIPDYQNPPAPATPVQLPPRHKVPRIVWWGLAILILLIAILLLITITKKQKKPRPRRSPRRHHHHYYDAQKGDIGVYLDSIGTVTPVYTSSITAQVTGIIIGVHYPEGQRVAKGDSLIDIDSRPYRAQLLQAQGASN